MAFSNAVTFTINRAPATMTLASPPPSLVYDDSSDVTAWVKAPVSGPVGAPTPSGPVTFTYYTGTLASNTPLALPPINAGIYTVVANYAGNSNYLPGQSAPVTFTIIQPAEALSVFFKVNDGSTQRSMVTSLTVTFSSVVSLGSGAISQVDSKGNAIGFTLGTTDNITFTLTFASSQFIGGSLANGRYTLTVHSAHVNTGGGPQLTADQSFNFWRLFGDYYGTGNVNNADKILFAQAYKGLAPIYLPYFDFDGNGTIGAGDLSAFNQDFGVSI